MLLAVAVSIEAVKQASVSEAREKIAGGNITIVDVRSEDAYVQSHVKGAVLLSADGVRADLARCQQQEVAFYCGSRSSSTAAAKEHQRETGSARTIPIELQMLQVLTRALTPWPCADSRVYSLAPLGELSAANVTVESGMPEQRGARL